MPSSRTANTRRNIAYGFIQLAASHLLPFVVRTIVLYRFGVAYIGLSSLFASILSVLSLTELGFGTAVAFSMYRPVADGDVDQVCAYLGYFRKTYRVIGTVILALGLAVTPFLGSLIREPTLPDGLNLYVCYLIFLANSAISYLLFGYTTVVPTAFQRQDMLSRVQVVVAMLRCVAQSAVLLLSTSFYLYLLSNVLMTVVHNLLNAHVVRRAYPDIRCRGEITREQRRELGRHVRGLLVNRLTNVSRNGIDSLCISSFVGLAATGMYSNYYYIMAAVLSCGSMVCSSMLASVGNSIATETREKNYRDLRLFDFAFMGIVGWATTCLLCLYEPFVAVWVGGGMSLGLPVAVGFSAYFYVLEYGAIQWLYHQGVGLWYEDRFIMVAESVANVALNVLLCRLLGVAGVIIATIVSVFFTNCVLCPRLLFREYFKNGRLGEFCLDHLSYALTMALTAATSWAICHAALPMGMADGGDLATGCLCLGGRLLVCTVTALALFWVVWGRSSRYAEALSLAKRVLDS